MFSIAIGGGQAIYVILDTLKWGNGAKFLQVRLDPAGGSAYTDMGTTSLLARRDNQVFFQILKYL